MARSNAAQSTAMAAVLLLIVAGAALWWQRGQAAQRTVAPAPVAHVEPEAPAPVRSALTALCRIDDAQAGLSVKPMGTWPDVAKLAWGTCTGEIAFALTHPTPGMVMVALETPHGPFWWTPKGQSPTTQTFAAPPRAAPLSRIVPAAELARLEASAVHVFVAPALDVPALRTALNQDGTPAAVAKVHGATLFTVPLTR